MKQYTQIAKIAALTIMLVLTGGLLHGTRAQNQICRDIGQIKVCADAIDEFATAPNGGGFRLRGNVRIGPKSGTAVVEVEDIGSVFDGSLLDISITTASYFHFNQVDPNTGAADFIIGDVRMINDVTGLTLLGTSVVPVTSTPGTTEVRVGRLFVDTVNGKIFNPAAGAVPTFVQDGITRNANIRLAFMTQVGAEVFYKEGGSVNERARVNAEFDLFARKFKGTLPVALKLGDSAENPNLEITIVSEFSETGVQTSKVNGFKFKLAGLLMEVSDAVVKPPTGTAPAEFTAANVKVLKTDNPGLPNLDAADPTLIFAFTNLKYKNGAWSLGGVTVPIKEWEVGPAFRMKNQTLGIINDTSAGANAQALEIKSTLQFGTGTDQSTLPVTVKVGRVLVNGQFKPTFAGGLGAISPKLGALTFKLTGATFVADAAEDFFGIKATTAALQWPPHLGGKTAAAINNFKLGTNVARKFIFGLGNGTIGLPEFENELFKGNLAATIGTVNETLTITGVGTLNLKLPGNGNSAGVATTAIMRYNKNATEDNQLDSDTVVNLVSVAGAEASVQPYEYQPVANTAISTCISVFGARTTCPDTTPPPPPAGPDPFEFKLTGFSMKLAGFGLTITNPKGTNDGGFSADAIALSLPVGMLSSLGTGTGIVVQGFGIAGNGQVAIQGGGFELAPISVGSVQFVGLKGNFLRKPDKSYEFTAAGKLPLSGIEPGANNAGIGVSITVRLAAAGTFNGVGVIVDFGSPPLPPIPIGSSGMNLTKITGAFDLTNQTVTIGMTLTATSKFKIPIGAASIPIATAQGGISAKFNPFLFSGNVKLSVLIFQVATASINIGAGQGFDGRDGMNVNATVDAVIVSGNFRMRIGKGTATDPEKRRFAASATWVLGIPANKYGIGRPPFNLGGINVALSGGVFTNLNTNPDSETVGVKASICGPGGNLCIGTFLNLRENIGGGDFIDFTNIDQYVIIPAAAARAAAAAGKVGYASISLTPQQALDKGLVLSASQVDGGETIMADTIPIEVTSTTTLLAGISHLSGTPVISLKLPDNTVLTEASVNGTTQTFLRETETVSDTTNLLFTISGATPGTYQLIIDNAPADYELVSYVINSSPQVTLTEATCGGPNVAGLTVTCHEVTALATAASPAAVDANRVNVKWSSSDIDSPNAKVAVGYAPDAGAPQLIEYADINFVAEDLPLGAGTQNIDLSQVGTGVYRPVVVVDDGENGVVISTNGTTITVVDLLPPAIPSGLAAIPGAGELQVRWDQNLEKDLAGYDIGFGIVNDSSQFIYTRTMGPKEVITGTNNLVDAKLWGLADDTTVFYGLRACDSSGNCSEWTPLQSAQPWAISPNTWNPVPNGQHAGNVEIAFATPMLPESLENALTVKDAAGNPLEGDQYFLLNAERTKIIGIGLNFEEAYDGPASAVLLGGSDGVQSEDGRTMGANYAWSFVLHHEAQVKDLFIPTVLK